MAEKINFTKDEQLVLLGLIEKHSAIINSHERDTATEQKKREAWTDVAISFNSSGHSETKRSWQQVRKWHQNKLLSAKKVVSKATKSKRLTGGGPPLADVDEITQKLVSQTKRIFVPLSNPFDSDAGHHDQDVAIEENIVNSDGHHCMSSTPNESVKTGFIYPKKRKREMRPTTPAPTVASSEADTQ